MWTPTPFWRMNVFHEEAPRATSGGNIEHSISGWEEVARFLLAFHGAEGTAHM